MSIMMPSPTDEKMSCKCIKFPVSVGREVASFNIDVINSPTIRRDVLFLSNYMAQCACRAYYAEASTVRE